jgi:hypothetical protein
MWKSKLKCGKHEKKNERCQAVGEDSLCLTLYLKVKGKRHGRENTNVKAIYKGKSRSFK